MDWYTQLTHLLWLAPPILQVGIVAAMVRYRTFRQFPVFMTYTIFISCFSVTTFIISRFGDEVYKLYFYFYWTGRWIEMLLSFAVASEIFSHVFRPYPGLAKLGRLLFRWSVAIVILVTLLTTLWAKGGDKSPLISRILLMDRALSLVECGLLFALFALASYLGLSWRNYDFGIALGFGLYGTVSLVGATLRMQFGPDFDDTLRILGPLTYNFCVVIFAYYLLRPEPARASVPMRPSASLRDWNAELVRLLQR